MNSKELTKLVVSALEDVKGQAIDCIDVRKLTDITDCMVIVTGTSSTHLKALADSVQKKLKEAKQEVVGVEGRQQSEWILVDAGVVVVHIMLAQVRVLYNLEELWNFSSAAQGKKST